MKQWVVVALAVGLGGCGDGAEVPADDSRVAGSPGAGSTVPAADHVFLNGGVYTVDPARPWAEAVAVADGEVTYVGSNDGARAWIGPDTRQHDLAGRMLLPGFHDAHIHLLSSGVNQMNCTLLDLLTLELIVERLEECAEGPGVGEGWILGGGWDRPPFEGGKPHKALLDGIFGERPVVLEASDGHTYWVSSRTLDLLGIDENTPDPEKGVIDRDPETGEATGLLDESAQDLVDAIAPQPSPERLVEGLTLAIEQAHRYGITSIIDPGINATNAQAYLTLSERGELPIRALVALSPLNSNPGELGEELYELIAQRDRFRGPHLRADSAKFFLDGVLETGTALLVDPYEKPEQDRSHPVYSSEALADHFTRLDRAGIQIHVHAIGDGAVRQGLDAFAGMREANGPSDNRHQISHLQLIHPDDVARFGELGIAATFQALWAYPDTWITELNLPVVGQERVDRMYPIASVKRAGGRIVGSSDWDVSTQNPLPAMEVGIRRQDPSLVEGPVLNANERVDLAAMIAAYTIEGAYVMGQGDVVGSIEVGKSADLVVLDRNLFEIPPTDISDAQVSLTLFEGRQVYPAAVSTPQ